MAFLDIQNVAIKGVSACVPKTVSSNRDYPGFTQEDAEKFITTTGIERRRIGNDSVCSSDLCYHAAEQLIQELKWEKSEIDCLVFVTQTPDYILPATSCILQERLGLSTECHVVDISLGCSGWIYGLSVISGLMSSAGFSKGLLLCGDTISKICSDKDKSTYPLFGDAGTATALEFVTGQHFKFHTSTDGSGFNAIIIPEGGYRTQVTAESLNPQTVEGEIERNGLNLILDGMDVFSFGISKAPQSINNLTEQFCINKDSVDYFIFHQANMFMNESIRKKLKLPKSKVPYSLKEFGNTSSATIPLTIVTQLRDELLSERKEFIGCGFGVGLSWGSVHFILDNIVCPKLIEI